jgi:serine/threonine-protein kinase
MGAIWLAHHTGLDVPCAVKFIHAEAAQSADLRARFEREAKAAAGLRSPNVVQIFDHGVWDESPYIAMEFLEGEDLAQRLLHRRTLAPMEVVSITTQVGRALTKAHAAGLIHRDLKPANIYLVRDEDREIAKVLDFGIAKANTMGTDGATKTGAILGTPYYMSPEQARGNKAIDHRADLWSLAVVVYQCVVGQLPFVSEALGDLMVMIIVDPIPVPSKIAPVPPGFDAWWARAASRDPAGRFQNARELTDALGLALGVTVQENLSAQIRAAAGLGAETLSPGMSQTNNPMLVAPTGGLSSSGNMMPAFTPPGGGFMPPGATPMPTGARTSNPGGDPSTLFLDSGAGLRTSNPSLPGIVPPQMTPMAHGMGATAHPPNRTGMVVAMAIGVVSLLAGVALFALKPGSDGPPRPGVQPSASMPSASSQPAATVEPPQPTASAAATPAVTAEAPSASALAPSASAVAGVPEDHKTAPSAKPATGPAKTKGKTDFGF